MSMFKYFKDKIKDSLSSFSKKTEEEGETVEETEEAPQETQEGTEQQQVESSQEQESSPEAPAKADESSAEAIQETQEESAEQQVESPQEQEPSHEGADGEAGAQEDVAASEGAGEEEADKEGFWGKLKGAFGRTPESEESAEEAGEETPAGEGEQPVAEEVQSNQQAKQDASPAATTSESSEQPVAEEEPSEQQQEEAAGETSAKKGFFGKLKQSVTSKRLTQDKFEELFWDLEVAMLENNVAMEVIEKIKQDLSQQIVDTPIPRNKIEQTIIRTLSTSIRELFEHEPFDLLEKMEEKKPYVICFVGVNGSGKTTTIAKMAHMLKAQGKDVVLAAADTFRAAAIDQLTYHAEQVGVKIIKHDYGKDAAAVAYDAINHAQSKGKDAVLIDTAGRMHSNQNLLDELKKVVRISEPDLKLFVGESITGNDCIEQAKEFNEAVGIDGIILSKADIDEKGGAAISVSYVTGKPILYLGTGQEYSDIEPFDKQKILETLNLEG